MSTPEFKCPICGKASIPLSRSFPFCCKRCKMIDLGLWLEGSYRVSREINPQGVDSFDFEGNGPLPSAAEESFD